MPRILILILIAALVGCDQLSAARGPQYVLHENGYYGYEADGGQVVMLAFLGRRDDTVQLLEQVNAYAAVVYECIGACEFMKTYGILLLGEPEVTETSRLRAAPGLVASIAFRDARAGHLDTYVTDNGYHYWASDTGLSFSPAQ